MAEESPPANDALKDILKKTSEVEYLTAISGQIDGLTAEQIPTFRLRLSNMPDVPDARRLAALDMVDRYWSDKAPRTFLDATAARTIHPQLDVQSDALRQMLSQDVEAAIDYYLRIPAYENFGEHCGFYRELSSIDASRAVRLYFESPDQSRTFDNPLDIAFEAWGKKDFQAAWNEAERIADTHKQRRILMQLFKSKPKQSETLVQSIKNKEVREGAMRDLEYLAKTNTPPSAEPKPDKSQQDKAQKDKAAAEEAAIEKLLQDGYIAFNQKQTNEAYYLYLSMLRRYPERAWDWFSDMKDSDSYSWNRYRELAEAWPKDKLADSTKQIFKGTRLRNITFGILLGTQWMKEDPEAAVPYLFSNFPQHGKEWINVLPHHAIIHVKKWNEEKALSIMDKIEDPYWRTIARNEVKLQFIGFLTPDKAIPALLALKDTETILRFPGFYRMHGSEKEDREFIKIILALGPEHASLRDQILLKAPADIIRANEKDVGSIPDIISAISDPEIRLQALMSIITYRAPNIIAARLLEILAELPPGTNRDKCMNSCMDTLTAADRLALLSKTQNVALRAMLARSLPTEGWSDENFLRCQSIIQALPEAWSTPELRSKWQSASMVRVPEGKWAETVRELYKSEGASSYFHQKMSQWLKTDPKALLDAIQSSDTLPYTGTWYMSALLQIHQGDHAATFRDYRANPVAPHFALSDFFLGMLQKNGRGAASNILLLTDNELRLRLIDTLILQWTQVDRDATANWVKSLPPGEDRKIAVTRLAERWMYGGKSMPEWITAELPSRQPVPEVPIEIVPLVPPTPEEIKAKQEKAQQEALAKESRRRTIETIRALAMIDEAGVIEQIGKLPAGAQKTDSLLGLLDYAIATENMKLRQSTISDLKGSKEILPKEFTTIILNSLPLKSIDEAIAYESELKDKEARAVAIEIIFTRWSAPEYQERIWKWIRSITDTEHRTALTNRHLRNMLRLAARNPSVIPDPEPALREIVTMAAREELIHAHLDGRVPDSQALEKAALPEPVKKEVLRMFENKK